MATFLLVLHVMVCLVLILVVLLQRGKGGDMGAVLGGGGSNTVFGGRGAGNFLTKLTTSSAIIFMGTSLSLSYLAYQETRIGLFDDDEGIEQEADAGLVELPDANAADGDDPGLEEIPMPDN